MVMRRMGIFLFVWLLISSVVLADERIVSYEVVAEIGEDASLTVHERIGITVEGEKVKRGIVRNIPVEHRDEAGNVRRAGFSLISATVDGAEVRAEVSRMGPQVEIRLGDPDVLLEHGPRVFDLTYRMTDQLLFLDDFDELFWNVTGPEWDFPIDRVSYRVKLPADGAERILAGLAFTGAPGEQGEDYTRIADDHFETTRTLEPGEAFSVAVAWEKGVIAPPPPGIGARIAAWLAQNKAAVVAGFLLLVTMYYSLAWFFLGRDPHRGTVVPLFAPPEGMEPGYARFVRGMGFSQECFAADLLHLAVRGVIHVEEDADGITLHRRFDDIQKLGLPASLHNLLVELFPKPDATAVSTTTQAGARSLYHARRQLGEIYEIRGKKLFTYNLGVGLLGLLIFLPLPLLLEFMESPLFEKPDVVDHLVYLFILFLGFGMAAAGLAGIREGLVRRFGSLWARLGVFAGAGLALLVGLRLLWGDLSADPVLTGGILASAAVAAIFLCLLPVRTREGVRLLDLVEGLALFMETAERDRLEMLNPPEETPALFEALLPYAFALDCADTWANRFQAMLEKASFEPDWYAHKDHDPRFRLRNPGFAVVFARTLADRTRRSAESYAPKTTGTSGSASWTGGGSGLGGGGSAGGGRGGGGGRGW